MPLSAFLYFDKKSYTYLAVCIIFPLFLITSCRNKVTQEAGYSQAFKPIYDSASMMMATNRIEKGLYYLDSSVSRIGKPNIDDKFRTYALHFNYWKNIKGNNKKALLYADSMLIMANKSVTEKQYSSNYAEANMAIGDVYFSTQRYNSAYQHYFEGLKTGRNSFNNRALADYSYRMGMILYKIGHFKLACNYFEESYRLSLPSMDKFADFYRKQEVLDNIGLSFKHNNFPDSAVFYFNKALTYIDENAPQFRDRVKLIEVAKGVVYGNKAEVLITKGNYADAVDLLKKSIAINLQKGNDNSDAQLAEIKLAWLYWNQNETQELFTLLKNLKDQFKTVKNANAEADWNRMMSKYYERKKEFEKANRYFETYNILRDSISGTLNLLKESNINEQLANFEKQYQIDNLKNESKIQQIILNVAIVCTLMAFVIIYLVIKYLKRSKEDILIVSALNEQVNEQKVNLEKTLEELKSSDLEKDRILRTVAHDLRNPIGGIASLTGLMEDDDYTDEQKHLITLIKETSHNSLELINEILEVTNNGASTLNKELVDINSLITKSVELLRFKAAEKAQLIHLDLLEVPEKLLISREKIWRVISNLISNAIKFSPADADIYVYIKDREKDIEIAVKDNGIGIPENMKPKIFNTFTEAKRVGTAGEKSFGLGLSISKQIIENHEGKLWVESQNGKGSTFFISLPKPPPVEITSSKNRRTKVLTT